MSTDITMQTIGGHQVETIDVDGTPYLYDGTATPEEFAEGVRSASISERITWEIVSETADRLGRSDLDQTARGEVAAFLLTLCEEVLDELGGSIDPTMLGVLARMVLESPAFSAFIVAYRCELEMTSGRHLASAPLAIALAPVAKGLTTLASVR